MDDVRSEAIERWRLLATGQAPLGWVVAAGVVLLALQIRHVRWAVRQGAGAPWRRLSAVCRALATTWLVFSLALPAWQRQRGVVERGPTLVVVDNSQSMRLAGYGGKTRAEAAADVVRTLQGKLPGPVQLFSLDGPCEDGARCAAPRRADTPLVAALAAAAAAPSRAPSAIVLVSDGQDTAGARAAADLEAAAPTRAGASAGAPKVLDAAAQASLGALKVPVSTVAVGPKLRDPRQRPDQLRMAEVVHDGYALVKTTTDVACVLASALGAARDVEVVLREDGVERARAHQTLPAGVGRTAVHFARRYDEVGERVLGCHLQAPSGVRVAPEHLVAAAILPVLRDKVRVLHVAGRPSWDERFLREVLKADRNVELISFFILRTPDDDMAIGEHELSLIPFPVARLFTTELKNFDVVVLQNFDPRPYQMTPYLPHLRTAVQQGLGLMMVGGAESFAQAGYQSTALQDVLPVELAAGPAPPYEPHTQLLARTTAAGAHHPLLASPGATGGRPLPLAELPLLEGYNPVAGVRAGAQLLLEGRGANGQNARPLLATSEPGRGRTAALLTDGSWRWRYVPGADGAAAQAHRQLWTGLLHWLSHDPALGRVRLTLAQRAFAAPEGYARPAGSVRALGADWRPLAGKTVTLTVGRHPHDPARGLAPYADPPPPPQKVRLGDDGRADWTLPRLPAGTWWVQADVGDGNQAAAASFVVAPSPEISHPLPDDALLRAIAEATHGASLTPATLADVATLPQAPAPAPRIAAQHQRAVWALPAAVAAFCAAWATSWLLGRRHGGR